MTGCKIHHLKMYFLLNMGIFQCLVSFRECNSINQILALKRNFFWPFFCFLLPEDRLAKTYEDLGQSYQRLTHREVRPGLVLDL